MSDYPEHLLDSKGLPKGLSAEEWDADGNPKKPKAKPPKED